MWLSPLLLYMYTMENEQAGQKEILNTKFEVKKKTQRCNVGAKACPERDENRKERLDWKWRKRVGTLKHANALRHDCTRLSFQQ